MDELTNFRPLRKQIGARKIDSEQRGATNILHTLQMFAVLGELGQEYNLHRSSLVFLLGIWLRNEHRTRQGHTPPGLRPFTKDYKGGYSKALIRAGHAGKEASGELHLTASGLAIVQRFKSALKYAGENYRKSNERSKRPGKD